MTPFNLFLYLSWDPIAVCQVITWMIEFIDADTLVAKRNQD
jgi:hypothetical protein